MIIYQKDIDRFYSYIEICNSGCWNFNLKSGQDGYPRFSINSKSYRANRISYIIHYGYIEDHLLIRHICHNKKCVNPEHLRLGSHQDNMNDTVNDDLQLKGSQIAQSKLTESDVVNILTDIYNDQYVNCSVYDISKKYNVSHNQIRLILEGKSWKHVTCKLTVPLSDIRDKIIGRSLHNSSYRHPTKLCASDVIDIKRRLSCGETAVSIAVLYNVSNSSIDSIKNGRTWTHV